MLTYNDIFNLIKNEEERRLAIIASLSPNTRLFSQGLFVVFRPQPVEYQLLEIFLSRLSQQNGLPFDSKAQVSPVHALVIYTLIQTNKKAEDSGYRTDPSLIDFAAKIKEILNAAPVIKIDVADVLSGLILICARYESLDNEVALAILTSSLLPEMLVIVNIFARANLVCKKNVLFISSHPHLDQLCQSAAFMHIHSILHEAMLCLLAPDVVVEFARLIEAGRMSEKIIDILGLSSLREQAAKALAHLIKYRLDFSVYPMIKILQFIRPMDVAKPLCVLHQANQLSSALFNRIIANCHVFDTKQVRAWNGLTEEQFTEEVVSQALLIAEMTPEKAEAQECVEKYLKEILPPGFIQDEQLAEHAAQTTSVLVLAPVSRMR